MVLSREVVHEQHVLMVGSMVLAAPQAKRSKEYAGSSESLGGRERLQGVLATSRSTAWVAAQ